MRFAYARRASRPWLEDAFLAGALVVVLALRPGGALAVPLAVAIGVVLVWGFATLHVPSRIELHADSVSFSRYGRTHTFAWRDVERVRVRRFLVKDRVLVRLVPAPPWRGRYWIHEGLEGYRELVERLEERARKAAGPGPIPILPAPIPVPSLKGVTGVGEAGVALDSDGGQAGRRSSGADTR